MCALCNLKNEHENECVGDPEETESGGSDGGRNGARVPAPQRPPTNPKMVANERNAGRGTQVGPAGKINQHSPKKPPQKEAGRVRPPGRPPVEGVPQKSHFNSKLPESG